MKSVIMCYISANIKLGFFKEIYLNRIVSQKDLTMFKVTIASRKRYDKIGWYEGGEEA